MITGNRSFVFMNFSLELEIPALPSPVKYGDSILLSGSCFTEHITERLAQHKFQVTSNPNGILFNPLSVATSLERYVSGEPYVHDDLFYLNEIWNSWMHHTRFSHQDKERALEGMNAALADANITIAKASWVILTLGSAFQYYLKDSGRYVSNNHRAPAQWFEKRLLETSEIVDALATAIQAVQKQNPDARFLFTISPVRHIREGIIENNRSKARLIEAVHTLCSTKQGCFYFPAYELVIDVLRDYRFYDIDYVHPNYLATNYVWERFRASCIDAGAFKLMDEIAEIVTASRHRPRFPGTDAHKKFLDTYRQKCLLLTATHPFLSFTDEIAAFTD